MSKLTDLTEVTTLADGDLGMVVDVSNTSMDATGTNSKVTLANLYAYIKAKTDTVYATIIGYTPENVANKSTTTALGTSDTLYPTQNAVKTYVDGLVAGLLDYRGAYDASVNTFPASGGSGTAGAVLKGDTWVISVAGTLGGTAVQIGDSLVANVDTPAQTAANWNILNGNISYVPEDQANKSDNTSLGTSTSLYPTQNAVKVYADTKALLAGSTSQAFSVSQLEVSNTDTTITRSAAGKIAVEGVDVLTVAGGTLTGSITLGENTGLALDPAGSADGKWSGITIAGTAGYTQAFGDLVYLAVADSRWELADADAEATGGYVMLGMVVSAGTDGTACTILLQGQIRADAKFPALTVGKQVFVGETAGAIQVAIPTGADNVIRSVGFALTADEIYFNPSQDYQLSVA